MAPLHKKHLLEMPPNTVKDLRQIHGLSDPKRLEEAIDILEQWVHKQDHFEKKDFKREYLEKTIIACKGSVEKAKKQIDRLCTMKTLLPQFFTKCNVKEELNQFIELGWIVPLPKLTDDFYRILIFRINDKPLLDTTVMEFFQYCMILCEYIKAHDYVNGFIIVYDYRQTNILDLVTKLSPVQLQQFMSILIEGYGARLKKLCVLTQSKVIDIFLKMVKQFLSHKISSRMCVYKTLEELYTVVPKDLLPVDYGGKGRPINDVVSDWQEELSTEQHVEYVQMMRKACTNEKLRKSDKFNEEYMGMPGSFRNLSVD